MPFASAQSRRRGALSRSSWNFNYKVVEHTIHSEIGAETVTANRDRVGELTVATSQSVPQWPRELHHAPFSRPHRCAWPLVGPAGTHQSCYGTFNPVMGQLLCQPHFGLRHQHLIPNCSYPWPRRPDLRRRPIGRRCSALRRPTPSWRRSRRTLATAPYPSSRRPSRATAEHVGTRPPSAPKLPTVLRRATAATAPPLVLSSA